MAENIEVKIKTLDNNNYPFSVPNTYTVKQLKDRVASTVNIPADRQRFIYLGRVLDNEKSLTDYDLNGKVIHLVQRAPPSEIPPRPPTGAGEVPPRSTTRQEYYRHFFSNNNNEHVRRRTVNNLIRMMATSAAMRLSHSSNFLYEAMLIIVDLQSMDVFARHVEPVRPVVGNAVQDFRINADFSEMLIEARGNTLYRRDIILNEGGTPEYSDATALTDAQLMYILSRESRRNEHEARGAALLANLMAVVRYLQDRLAPYASFVSLHLIDDSRYLPDGYMRDDIQRLYDRVMECTHFLTHASHAISDINVDFRTASPRRQILSGSNAPDHHHPFLEVAPMAATAVFHLPMTGVVSSNATSPSTATTTVQAAATTVSMATMTTSNVSTQPAATITTTTTTAAAAAAFTAVGSSGVDPLRQRQEQERQQQQGSRGSNQFRIESMEVGIIEIPTESLPPPLIQATANGNEINTPELLRTVVQYLSRQLGIAQPLVGQGPIIGQSQPGGQSQPRGQGQPGGQSQSRGQGQSGGQSQSRGQSQSGGQCQSGGQGQPGGQSQPGEGQPGRQSQPGGQGQPGGQSQPRVQGHTGGLEGQRQRQPAEGEGLPQPPVSRPQIQQVYPPEMRVGPNQMHVHLGRGDVSLEIIAVPGTEEDVSTFVRDFRARAMADIASHARVTSAGNNANSISITPTNAPAASTSSTVSSTSASSSSTSTLSSSSVPSTEGNANVSRPRTRRNLEYELPGLRGPSNAFDPFLRCTSQFAQRRVREHIVLPHVVMSSDSTANLPPSTIPSQVFRGENSGYFIRRANSDGSLASDVTFGGDVTAVGNGNRRSRDDIRLVFLGGGGTSRRNPSASAQRRHTRSNGGDMGAARRSGGRVVLSPSGRVVVLRRQRMRSLDNLSGAAGSSNVPTVAPPVNAASTAATPATSDEELLAREVAILNVPNIEESFHLFPQSWYENVLDMVMNNHTVLERTPLDPSANSTHNLNLCYRGAVLPMPVRVDVTEFSLFWTASTFFTRELPLVETIDLIANNPEALAVNFRVLLRQFLEDNLVGAGRGQNVADLMTPTTSFLAPFVNVLVNNEIRNLVSIFQVRDAGDIDVVESLCFFNVTCLSRLIFWLLGPAEDDMFLEHFMTDLSHYMGHLALVLIAIFGDRCVAFVEDLEAELRRMEELHNGRGNGMGWPLFSELNLSYHMREFLYAWRRRQPDQGTPRFVSDYVLPQRTVAQASFDQGLLLGRTYAVDREGGVMSDLATELQDIRFRADIADIPIPSAESDLRGVVGEGVGSVGVEEVAVGSELPVEELPPVAGEGEPDVPLEEGTPSEEWGTVPNTWVPIIARDSQALRRQASTIGYGPYSEAYLSGMPTKRRKLLPNNSAADGAGSSNLNNGDEPEPRDDSG